MTGLYIFFTREVSTMNYSAGGKFNHILSILLEEYCSQFTISRKQRMILNVSTQIFFPVLKCNKSRLRYR